MKDYNKLLMIDKKENQEKVLRHWKRMEDMNIIEHPVRSMLSRLGISPEQYRRERVARMKREADRPCGDDYQDICGEVR